MLSWDARNPFSTTVPSQSTSHDLAETVACTVDWSPGVATKESVQLGHHKQENVEDDLGGREGSITGSRHGEFFLVNELGRVLVLDFARGCVVDGDCRQLKEGVRHVINLIIERAEQTAIIETGWPVPHTSALSAPRLLVAGTVV